MHRHNLGMIAALIATASAVGTAGPAFAQQVPPPPPSEQPVQPDYMLFGAQDIAGLQADLMSGRLTSEYIVRLYVERMAHLDDSGPTVNAVSAVYSSAIEIARQRDAQRNAGRLMGPLHGIPILIKDNIEADGGLATTAGSRALMNNVTQRDAPLVARLRAAGAIILGRTNLTEWANFRDAHATSGWSGMWGLTRNPYSLDRTACGSSSGSAAAVAAGFAPAAIGTETDGSIVCPAGSNGIVGFKPTVGLVSRRYIIPISASQDTAGPMTRTVRDAALLLTVIAGTDPGDPATVEADAHRVDYVAALNPDTLRGLRIGVLWDEIGDERGIRPLLDRALEVLRAQGATLVDIRNDGVNREALSAAETTVLLTEFRAGINAYLADNPNAAAASATVPRDLAGLIAFNRADDQEMRFFGQSLFEQAEATGATGGIEGEAYRTALATAQRLAREDGIDRLMRDHQVDLLLAVTNGPAWSIDIIHGDHYAGPGASGLPAVAGYPHLTVRMGTIEGLPVGLSLIGRKWDDARVLAAGDAYERATPGLRQTVPGFQSHVPIRPFAGPRDN
jgi:amidase